MASGFFKIFKGLNAQPVTGSTVSAAGDVAYNLSTNQLELFTTAVESITTASNTQTLINKSLDAGTNTITNIVNANIAAGAAIAYSKLNLAGSIQNSDLAPGFVFPNASLTSGQILVGNASNVAMAVPMTGDVGIDNTGLTTIQPGVVSNSKLATMAANTFKGNNTGATGAPLDLTVTQTQTALSIPTSSTPLPTLSGGTGTSAASANAAFNALSPMTTTGDMIYEAAGVATRLAIGTTNQVLTVTGGVPVWGPGTGGAVSPTVTRYLTPGTFSYSAPSGVTSIKVTLAGGGGGGDATGTITTHATVGTISSFGTTLLVGNPGNPGVVDGGGVGGTASVGTGAIQIVAVSGGNGSNGIHQVAVNGNVGVSGAAGVNAFGGGVGYAPGPANTGAGGSGGNIGNNMAVTGGAGGGAGGYTQAYIANPTGSYTVVVGSGGSAGIGSLNGFAGGSGVVIIEESYANGAVGTATTVTGNVAGSQITGPLASSIVQGTIAGGNATAGYIGEFISANSTGVSPVTSGVYVTLASISLTAGDWDVDAQVQLATGATTAATEFTGAISLNATSLDSSANGGIFQTFGSIVASSVYSVATSRRRFNITSTTTVNLVGQLTFSVLGGATWNVNNLIQARRVR